MTAEIKRIIAYVVAGALVLALGIAVINAVTIRGEAKAYLSELKLKDAANRALAKKSDAEREALRQKIAEGDKRIASLTRDIGQKDNAIGQLTKRIDGLNGDLAAATTDAERVPILTALVKQWSEKFDLSEGKCGDYQKLMFDLSAQYIAQARIADTWRIQYEAERDARATADNALSALKSDVRKARLAGVVKSTFLFGFAAYLIYHLASK